MSESLRGIFENVPKENLEARANGERLSELRDKYKLNQAVAKLNTEVSRLGGVTEKERDEHRIMSRERTSRELSEIKRLATEVLEKIDAYEKELAQLVKPLVPGTERDSTVIAQRKHVEKILEDVGNRIDAHEAEKIDLR